MKTVEIEIRCPAGPKRLFSKLRFTGQEASYTDDNLLELSCADCTRTVRREGRTITRVLHRYNFMGDLVETVEVLD